MSIYRKVVNTDPHADGRKVLCAWLDCPRDGFELHKVRQHTHARVIPCAAGEHITFVFCSERHRQLWLYANNPAFRPPGPAETGKLMTGRLPTGSRGTIL